MQVCTLLQTDNNASTPPFFTGRIPFLLPNQQRQSTEGNDDANMKSNVEVNDDSKMFQTFWQRSKMVISTKIT